MALEQAGTDELFADVAQDAGGTRRMLFSGPSGCGKTLLMSIVILEHLPDYAEVHMIGHTIASQAVYTLLRKRLASRGTRVYTSDKFDVHEVCEIEYRQRRRTELGMTRPILLIIDDSTGDGLGAVASSPLSRLFTTGRHKQISVVIATQKLTALSLYVRTNYTDAVFFATASEPELRSMYETASWGSLHRFRRDIDRLLSKKYSALWFHGSTPYLISPDFVEGAPPQRVHWRAESPLPAHAESPLPAHAESPLPAHSSSTTDIVGLPPSASTSSTISAMPMRSISTISPRDAAEIATAADRPIVAAAPPLPADAACSIDAALPPQV